MSQTSPPTPTTTPAHDNQGKVAHMVAQVEHRPTNTEAQLQPDTQYHVSLVRPLPSRPAPTNTTSTQPNQHRAHITNQQQPQAGAWTPRVWASFACFACSCLALFSAKGRRWILGVPDLFTLRFIHCCCRRRRCMKRHIGTILIISFAIPAGIGSFFVLGLHMATNPEYQIAWGVAPSGFDPDHQYRELWPQAQDDDHHPMGSGCT